MLDSLIVTEQVKLVPLLTLFEPSNQPINVYPALVVALKTAFSPTTLPLVTILTSPASLIFLSTETFHKIYFAVIFASFSVIT